MYSCIPEQLGAMDILMIVKCIFGAIFVVSDIVLDFLMAYEYYRATDFYAELSKEYNLIGPDFNIWASKTTLPYSAGDRYKWEYLLLSFED